MKRLLVCFLASLPVLVSIVATAEPISLKKRGSAVSMWKDNRNDFALESDGGVFLGGSRKFSMPIYRFLIPPTVIAKGISELKSAQIVIDSHETKGRIPFSLWHPAKGQKELGELQEELASRSITLADVENYVYSEDGKSFYLFVLVDVTAPSAGCRLKTISLNLDYSGTVKGIANYLACLGGANAIDAFRTEVVLRIEKNLLISARDLEQAVREKIWSEIEDTWMEVLPLASFLKLLKLDQFKRQMETLIDPTSFSYDFELIKTGYNYNLSVVCSQTMERVLTASEQWLLYAQRSGSFQGPEVDWLNNKIQGAVYGLDNLLEQINRNVSALERVSSLSSSYSRMSEISIAAYRSIATPSSDSDKQGSNYLMALRQSIFAMQLSKSNAFTVSGLAGLGGTINVLTPNTIAGGSAVVEARPDPNYAVDQWFVNGSFAQNGQISLNVPNVQKDIFVQVSFKRTSIIPGPGNQNEPPASADLPEIRIQPQSQSTITGNTATFSVSATGPGPLRFQWRFRGADIPGETREILSVRGTDSTKIGEYGVVVSQQFSF